MFNSRHTTEGSNRDGNNDVIGFKITLLIGGRKSYQPLNHCYYHQRPHREFCSAILVCYVTLTDDKNENADTWLLTHRNKCTHIYTYIHECTRRRTRMDNSYTAIISIPLLPFFPWPYQSYQDIFELMIERYWIERLDFQWLLRNKCNIFRLKYANIALISRVI